MHKEVGVHAPGFDRGVDPRGQDGTGEGHEKNTQPVFPTDLKDDFYRCYLL